MSALTVRCLRAAIAFLLLGVALGVCFAFDRSLGPALRPLHTELNLWGWTTLFIYGMAYHMVPRFVGRPLPAPHLAMLQSWLAIAGVVVAAAGWVGASREITHLVRALLVTGGVLQSCAALLFLYLLGRLLLSGLFEKRDPAPSFRSQALHHGK